ncbi:MAG TPA: FG-GAP-like repeat-containing protein, partial [Cyclobacteriaceae bacterium]|nr:FG-GAP-like repeat-containing protein [Cyclobacteriaceae bacterium]
MRFTVKYYPLLALAMIFIVGNSLAQQSTVAYKIGTGGTSLNYINAQDGTLSTSASGLPLGDFEVKDNADSDSDPTNLISITFAIENYSNLRRIALFDGTTLVSDQEVVDQFVTFNIPQGQLSAPDGSTDDFSIRASFKSIVTDKQRIQLTVTHVVQGNGSGFAQADGGGAQTPAINNFISVTAAQIVITDVSLWVIPNNNFHITIKSIDNLGNVDLDDNRSITLSKGGGSNAGNFSSDDGFTKNLAEGVQTWAALKFASSGSGIIDADPAGALPNKTVTIPVTAMPPDPDPSGPFTASAGFNSVDLSFTAFNSTANRSGYLILRRTNTSPDLTNVTDGTSPASLSLGSTTLVADITAINQTTYVDAGLQNSTRYVYTIVPYNAVVGTGSTYTYNTSSGIEFVNATTLTPPPVITDFSPKAGPVGTEVTITGLRFNTDPNQNIVFFGAMKCNVSSATSTTLVVNVPAGATNVPITVATNGLTASSSYPFQLTFAGDNSLSSANFASTLNYPLANSANLGSDPNSIVSHDINDDGRPDIIVNSPGGSTISILASNLATGTYDRTDLPAGAGARTLAVGDLNGDGRKDIIVGNRSAKNVSVFKNNSISGSLSLTSIIDLGVVDEVNSVAIADIDVDGRADIVVLTTSVAIQFFRNIGSPGILDAQSFAPREQWDTGLSVAGLNHLVLSDLDNDGKPEMLTTYSPADQVFVFRNTSTPGGSTASMFEPYVTFATGDQPVALSVADIDGDHKPDIAVANSADRSVSILRNQITSGTYTASSFAAKVEFVTSDYNLATTIAVTIADLSGDGKPEIIATNWNEASQVIFKNTSTSGTIDANSFDEPFKVSVGPAPFHALVADLNNDNRPDLATGINYQVPPYSLVVNENLIPPPVITGLTPRTGSPGAVVAIEGSNFGATAAENIIYFGAARAEVVNVTLNVLNVKVPFGATYGPVTASVNGKTARSAASFTVSNPGQVPINASAFTSQTRFSATGRVLGVGDMNNDGKIDVVVASDTYVSVYLNKSVAGTINTNSLSAAIDYGIPAIADQMLIEDMNDDGKLDIILKGASSGSIYIIRNTTAPGTNTFSTDGYAQAGAPANIKRMATGDVNGDGRVDLIYTADNGVLAVAININAVGVLANINGFAAPVELMPEMGLSGHLVVTDFTGDNRPDLAVAALNPGSGVPVLLFYKNIGESRQLTAESFDAVLATSIGNVGNTNIRGLHAVDVNADGAPDLILRSDKEFYVLINTTSGGAVSWGVTTIPTGNVNSAGLDVGDLDGDYRPDFVLPLSANNGVNLLSNSSAANNALFSTPVALTVTDVNPSGVVVADIDGDGKSDLVVKGDDVNGGLPRFVVVRNGTTDTAAPTIQLLNPADNATDVPTSTSSFSITFNEAIKKGTGNISLRWGTDQMLSISIDNTNTSFNILTIPITGL